MPILGVTLLVKVVFSVFQFGNTIDVSKLKKTSSNLEDEKRLNFYIHDVKVTAIH